MFAPSAIRSLRVVSVTFRQAVALRSSTSVIRSKIKRSAKAVTQGSVGQLCFFGSLGGDRVLGRKIFSFFLVVLMLGTVLFIYHFRERRTDDYMIYAEANAEGTPTVMAAHYFSELVKERTNGRIQILVYAAGRLGSEQTVVNLVQSGCVDFARVSAAALSVESDGMKVLQYPYLFRDKEHLLRILDGEIGEDMLAELESYGMVGLAWHHCGFRHFYFSGQEICSLEDFAGRKLRVQDTEEMRGLARSFGAIPVSMPFSELLAGFQIQAVEGAENNFISYESEGHYQFARFCVKDAHTCTPGVQIISREVKEELSEEDWEIIRACAEEAERYERSIWDKMDSEAETRLLEQGVVIRELSREEKKLFKKKTQDFYDEFTGEHAELLEKIRRS